MRKTLLFSLLLPAMLGGCITHYHYCSCGDRCKCSAAETIKAGDPIVSPNKIDDTKQDSGAPKYPDVKPWYVQE